MDHPDGAYEGLTKLGRSGVRWSGQVRLVREKVEEPLQWSRASRVFVNSMSDLFHDRVPEGFIREVFDTMTRASRHQFQVLTKRSERLRSLGPALPWPPNVWMGVSVESNDFLSRIDDLRAIDAAVRFLSLEPLLGPLPDLDLAGIHWVIVGGESGPGCRPVDRDWIVDIREKCQASSVPFFFKQWGGVRKGRSGRLLDGQTWDEMPGRAPAASPLS